MIARSLRIRLLAAAAFSIGVALIVAQFGLNALFERHVVRRMAAELEVTLLQLAAGISILPDGAVEMTKELPDPRFSVPYSGFYWQIEQSGKGVILRSRSLWDGELAIPQKVEQSVRQSSLIVAGPARTKAIARLRDLVFPSASGDIPLRLVVATDTAALDVAVRDFSGDVTPSLVLLAIVLLVAAWVQVHLGLSPLEALRRGIAAIRSGDVRRLDAAFPHEVMPLVHEANALLDGQDAMITQARTRAADLAHGLKTPLTALLGDARRLRDLGQHEIAAEIDGLAQTMQRHIDHELARARIGSRVLGRGEHTLVRQNLAQVIKTLQRTPQGAALRWEVSIPEDVKLPMDTANALELFGNLLENAVKWASSQITIAATSGDETRITIADDGPGTDEQALQLLGRRGLRLDMAVEGSGLGLAIVREIVMAHRGNIHFQNRQPRGFAVTLVFSNNMRE